MCFPLEIHTDIYAYILDLGTHLDNNYINISSECAFFSNSSSKKLYAFKLK